jgi:hypothetical protein
LLYNILLGFNAGEVSLADVVDQSKWDEEQS